MSTLGEVLMKIGFTTQPDSTTENSLDFLPEC
jgi:hypothetical protein